MFSPALGLEVEADNTQDTAYWTDMRNDFILDSATISIGMLIAYPEYLSGASLECRNLISKYNAAYDVYQGEILKAVDFSSDGTNDFTGYDSCTKFGFRYNIVHYNDKMRSTHYGVCSHERCTPADFDSFLDKYLFALKNDKVKSGTHRDELLRLLDHPIRVYDSDVENKEAKNLKAKHILSLISVLS